MDSDLCTFGKEAVPDGDSVCGVRRSGGTTRLSSIIPPQLTGQSKHDYAAVICFGQPHAALCCTAAQMPDNYREHEEHVSQFQHIRE